MEHVQYGPAYDDAAIEAVLRRNGLCYRRSDDIAEAAAALVAEGKVVGWFQGRMEAGPRALGGRSILADPRACGDERHRERQGEVPRTMAAVCAVDPRREGGRLSGRSGRCAVHGDGLRGRPRTARRRSPPRCMPADRTTRPQTVRREVNPRFWALIDAFRRRTGVPGVLNTSFNVKGEPIVCSPTDALRCFYGTGMDALAIGSFLLEKPGIERR